MAILNCFSTGGALPDNLTATPAEVMSGYVFLGVGSDDEQTGTLALTGNAVVNHVLKGETFYNTNPKNKLTGTMSVNSILSFKAQVASGRSILFTWQNPVTASGRPFSGVCINYSTSGYPNTGGTRLYMGAGNNSAPGGTSQIVLNVPNLNTTYFFSCYSYANVNDGANDLYGTIFNSSVATGGNVAVSITATQDYTIPAGYTLMDVFLVGGGDSGIRGGGNSSSWKYAGSGGGGGYTGTWYNISITGGEVIKFNVGSGGGYVPGLEPNQNGVNTFNRGGASNVVRDGNVLATIDGGNSFNGGSGGGAYGYQYSTGENRYVHYVGTGGSNGNDGGSTPTNGGSIPGGKGQGHNTQAWGTGAVYAAGGGGGATPGAQLTGSGGNGGSPGGGRGGNAWAGGTNGDAGNPGSANTGSGGGGGGGCSYYRGWYGSNGGGGAGGSGIILVNFH